MVRSFAAAFALILSLAGCGDTGDGTTISINSVGSNGNVTMGADGKTGAVSINAPGFSGNIRLPRIKLDAGDFDLNGVKLYPGSTIDAMNIDAQDGGGRDTDRVRISFDSPANPAKVQQWFLEKLNRDAKFTVQADGKGLVGTTDDNQPFRLELAPTGDGHAKGTISIGS